MRRTTLASLRFASGRLAFAGARAAAMVSPPALAQNAGDNGRGASSENQPVQAEPQPPIIIAGFREDEIAALADANALRRSATEGQPG